MDVIKQSTYLRGGGGVLLRVEDALAVSRVRSWPFHCDMRAALAGFSSGRGNFQDPRVVSLTSIYDSPKRDSV